MEVGHLGSEVLEIKKRGSWMGALPFHKLTGSASGTQYLIMFRLRNFNNKSVWKLDDNIIKIWVLWLDDHLPMLSSVKNK